MTRLGCALLLMASGCIVGEDGMEMQTPPKSATANIEPTTDNTVTGTAKFTIMDNQIMLVVMVQNAPEGMHGFHIHQNPACGNNGMDAGAHWDGEAAGDPLAHGLPDSTLHHGGDTGNIAVGADGTGMLMFHSSVWTIGDGTFSDVVNHAVIFHQNADDGSMASAGARLGCGIINLDS